MSLLGSVEKLWKEIKYFSQKYVYKVHDAIVFSAVFFTWLYIQGLRQVLRLRKQQCKNCIPEVFERHQLLEHNPVLKLFDPILSTEWSSDFSHTVLGSACPICFLFGNFLQDVEKMVIRYFLTLKIKYFYSSLLASIPLSLLHCISYLHSSSTEHI